MTNEDLAAMFGSLRPWSRSSDFRDQDWENYVRVARRVQQTDSQVVEAALDSFVKAEANDTVTDYTSESKPFLLMRVVFDLPESAPVGEQMAAQRMDNWPKPDEDGRVSLAWPISWQSGSRNWWRLMRVRKGLHIRLSPITGTFARAIPSGF